MLIFPWLVFVGWDRELIKHYQFCPWLAKPQCSVLVLEISFFHPYMWTSLIIVGYWVFYGFYPHLLLYKPQNYFPFGIYRKNGLNSSDFPILVLKNEPLQVHVFKANSLQNSKIIGKYLNLIKNFSTPPFFFLI